MYDEESNAPLPRCIRCAWPFWRVGGRLVCPRCELPRWHGLLRAPPTARPAVPRSAAAGRPPPPAFGPSPATGSRPEDVLAGL